MNSAGTLSDTVSPALRRLIPACYDDEFERWALETSGWTDYSWDIGADDGENLARNEPPPSFNTSTSEQRPLEPIKITEMLRKDYKKAQDASEYYSPALDLFGIGSSPHDADAPTLVSMRPPEPVQANLLPMPFQSPLPRVIEPQDYVRLPGVDNPPVAIAPSLLSGSLEINGLRSGLPTTSVSPAPTSTPRARMLTPYSPSPTPGLSPSGSSVCSLEDVKSEEPVPMMQGLSAYDQAHFRSHVAPQKTLEPEIADLFSFPHVVSPWATLPTIMAMTTISEHSTAPLLMRETRMSAREMSNPPGQPPTRSKSTVRSKRNTTTRAKRVFQPYKRKNQVRQASPSPMPAGGELTCDECDYKQNPGPGCRRSFKRHLETHERYKVHEWRCRGQLQPDGTYFGGCNKTFSRRDALNRHVKTSGVCYSEIEPMQYIRRNHSGVDGK